jgi:hypothetical protein
MVESFLFLALANSACLLSLTATSPLMMFYNSAGACELLGDAGTPRPH